MSGVMDGATRCPHCGSSAGGAEAATMMALSREVERLREVAEGRSRREETDTIDALTREVRQLRETVARLRGSSFLSSPAAPARVP